MVKYRMDRLEELAKAFEQQETIRGMLFDMNLFHGITNTEKWRAEREKLERGEVDDHPYCGTAGCIGGWITALFSDLKASDGKWSEEGAFKLVTIQEEDDEDNHGWHYGDNTPMHVLFYPPHSDSWGWITREVAAAAVREFMATETVNWYALKEKYGTVVDESDEASG